MRKSSYNFTYFLETNSLEKFFSTFILASKPNLLSLSLISLKHHFIPSKKKKGGIEGVRDKTYFTELCIFHYLVLGFTTLNITKNIHFNTTYIRADVSRKTMGNVSGWISRFFF